MSEQKVIDISEQQKPVPKVVLDFGDESTINDDVKQMSGDASTNSRNTSDNKKPSLDEIRSEINAFENDPKNQASYDDVQDVANFIMEGFDTLVSTLCRFYAGDSSTTAYEIPVKKLEKLKSLLAKILVKYAVKFPIEFMFLLTVAFTYSVPIIGARKFRKERIARQSTKLKPGPKPKEQTTDANVTSETTSAKTEPEIVVAEPVVEEQYQRKKMRRPGGIKKSI